LFGMSRNQNSDCSLFSSIPKSPFEEPKTVAERQIAETLA
jgi:hypothetical protein